MPACESELRAILQALTKWRQFIVAGTVTIETARDTLGRILRQRQVNARLECWPDKSVGSNVEVAHYSGRREVADDASSRRPDFVAALMQIERSKERRKESLTKARSPAARDTRGLRGAVEAGHGRSRKRAKVGTKEGNSISTRRRSEGKQSPLGTN